MGRSILSAERKSTRIGYTIEPKDFEGVASCFLLFRRESAGLWPYFHSVVD